MRFRLFGPCRFSSLTLLVLLLHSTRVLCGLLSRSAEVICARVPGLTAKQQEMCRSSPDAMVAVGDGVTLATAECRYQFRHHRWNCTAISNPTSFGHVVIVGSREAAFTYAIWSAGVAYAVAAACARGNISSCGCASVAAATPREAAPPTPAGWKWAGCSVDVAFGMRFARRFLDARELEGDERSLMNLHNNKAGRKSIKLNLLTECKCHGVSGSCTMRTCWKTLPPFRQIGDSLMKKYYRARPVAAATATTLQPGVRSLSGSGRRSSRTHLVLKKGKIPIKKAPKKSELVFLQLSPNYCERDITAGSLGTVGRSCNRTSTGNDGCDLMCCGRGYNTHQYTRTQQCRCTFHWCCHVKCDTCSERTEEYTCK